MLDTLTKPTAELPLEPLSKRERIEAELKANPNRADREIARVVGCDHKTIGAARERLGIATPLPMSSPPVVPAKVDVEEEEAEPFAPGDDDVVVQHQPAISIYLNAYEAVVIRQHGADGPDCDPFVFINREHLTAVIAKLQEMQRILQG